VAASDAVGVDVTSVNGGCWMAGIVAPLGVAGAVLEEVGGLGIRRRRRSRQACLALATALSRVFVAAATVSAKASRWWASSR
jgi:hypothetical protein